MPTASALRMLREPRQLWPSRRARPVLCAPVRAKVTWPTMTGTAVSAAKLQVACVGTALAPNGLHGREGGPGTLGRRDASRGTCWSSMLVEMPAVPPEVVHWHLTPTGGPRSRAARVCWTTLIPSGAPSAQISDNDLEEIARSGPRSGCGRRYPAQPGRGDGCAGDHVRRHAARRVAPRCRALGRSPVRVLERRGIRRSASELGLDPTITGPTRLVIARRVPLAARRCGDLGRRQAKAQHRSLNACLRVAGQARGCRPRCRADQYDPPAASPSSPGGRR